MKYFEIGNEGLLASLVLIILVLILNYIGKTKIGKDITFGTLRCFIQLMLVGYVLKVIFDKEQWYWVGLAVIFMVLVAGYEAIRREQKPPPRAFLYIVGTILISTVLVMSYSVFFVIKVKPWYNPQYLIPIMGMLIGNAMNGASLLINRLRTEIKKNKNIIESKLALGATPRQAVGEFVRHSVKSAMIPTLNNLMIIGIVTLPGMMTGQIIAGASPLSAVKYQIAIMYMISTSNIVTIFVTAFFVYREYFTSSYQIKEDLL